MTVVPKLPDNGKTCDNTDGPDGLKCQREPHHPTTGHDGFHAAYDGEDLVRW